MSEDLASLIREIESDLPGWEWSVSGSNNSACAKLTADGFHPKECYVGNMKQDMATYALRAVITAAKADVARANELPDAKVFLLSYERRQRRDKE